MTIINRVLLASLLLSPVAAGAQTAATDAKKDKNDPNRVICRSVESTGSRLGKKKECHTAAEWAEAQAISRRDVEKFQANRWSVKQ